MKGWMYILKCSDGSYYTGSTNNLELRMEQHTQGKGANHTKSRLPVKLIYIEDKLNFLQQKDILWLKRNLRLRSLYTYFQYAVAMVRIQEENIKIMYPHTHKRFVLHNLN